MFLQTELGVPIHFSQPPTLRIPAAVLFPLAARFLSGDLSRFKQHVIADRCYFNH